jgi:cytochrome c oxidase subunit 2
VIGSFGDDPVMRVQCAELCGLGHARMWTKVEVMSRADFDAWMAAAGA